MSSNRKPWKFFNAYCDFKTTEYGWTADGRTPRAETELVPRLDTVMIKRPRKVIWSEQPPKTRQFLYIDADLSQRLDKKAKDKKKAYFSEVDRILPYKLPAITENVMAGLAANEKSIVWGVTHESIRMLSEAIEEAATSKEHSARMRNVNFNYWVVHGADGEGGGVDIKRRNEIAMDFRKHRGAGLIISTLQALNQSISLGPLKVIKDGKVVEEYEGAHTEHWTSLHPEAGMMLQGENRPYELGVRGLTMIYYLLKTREGNSIDERMFPRLMDRMQTMEKLQNEDDAAGLLLAAKPTEAALDDLWGDMFSLMDTDGELEVDDDAPIELADDAS